MHSSLFSKKNIYPDFLDNKSREMCSEGWDTAAITEVQLKNIKT